MILFPLIIACIVLVYLQIRGILKEILKELTSQDIEDYFNGYDYL